MTQTPEQPVKVFQFAKRLNISHKDIISFLEAKGISASVNTKLEGDIQQMLNVEFASDAKKVDIIKSEREKLAEAAEEIKKKVEQQKKDEEDARVKAEEYRVRKIQEAEVAEKLEAERQEKEKEARRLAEIEQKKAKEEMDRRRKEEEEAKKLLEEEEKKKLGARKKTSGIADGSVVSSDKLKDEVEEEESINKPGKKSRKKRKKVVEVDPEQNENLFEKKLDDLKQKHRHATKRFQVSEMESRLDKFKKKKTGPGDTAVPEPSAGVRRGGRRGNKVDQVEVSASIKQTLASLDEKKGRKKYHKRNVSDSDEYDEDDDVIQVMEFISVEELSRVLNVSYTDIIGKCMGMGLMVTINQRLDWDTIELLCSEFDVAVEKAEDFSELDVEEDEDESLELVPRSPVVTVMGHVDHGKTSILDYIRRANVVSGESGGITQHIGAYRVKTEKGSNITFLDTPGHEAFTAMRARGAQITDIVVVVVAADDGVMPQTREALNHAQAAGVPIIIAINKMDKPEADPDRVKRELSENNILVEDWGGQVQSVPVSAKKGTNIDKLLDAILLEAEVLDLKAPVEGTARGMVIESKLDKGMGPVATVLVQKGILRIGDSFVCGRFSGRVRAMTNEWGERLAEANPSDPIQIQGFEDVPQAGDQFIMMDDEREAKRIATERKRIHREQEFRAQSLQTLEEIGRQIAEGKTRELNLIIKGDVDGSIEALADAFMKLSTKEVAVRVLHRGIGMINESDVNLASASKAIIIGFHVNTTQKAKDIAGNLSVEIRYYTVIYDAVEDVKLSLEGLLEPEKVREVTGTAEIRMIIKVPKAGKIGGSYVTSGKVTRGSMIRILREGESIFDGFLTTLKRFKDDVKEVKESLECGINIQGFDDYEVGDVVECYTEKSIKRTLQSK